MDMKLYNNTNVTIYQNDIDLRKVKKLDLK